MKEIFNKIKIPLIIVVAIFFSLFVYKTFFVKEESNLAVDITASTSRVQIDKDLLPLISLVKDVNFNGAIFNDPLFKSLSDFSKPIEPEPVGRENPFSGALLPSSVSGEVIPISGGTEDRSSGTAPRSGLPPGQF